MKLKRTDGVFCHVRLVLLSDGFICVASTFEGAACDKERFWPRKKIHCILIEVPLHLTRGCCVVRLYNIDIVFCLILIYSAVYSVSLFSHFRSNLGHFFFFWLFILPA